jgi:hypothetical protein
LEEDPAMPNARLEEGAGLNDEQLKAVKSYREALEESVQYCQPYHEKFVRFIKLFMGEAPPEVGGTFSKVMLWFAMSMIERELPSLTRMFFTRNWFDVNAREYTEEPVANDAKEWLSYQMETVQKLPRNVIPSLQTMCVCGSAFRFYGHKYVKRTKSRRVHDEVMGYPTGFRSEQETVSERSLIYGHHTDVFNVFVSPGGGLINDYDHTGENLNDCITVFTYPTRTALEEESDFWDKDQLSRMFNKKSSSDLGRDPSQIYKTQILDTKGGWQNFTVPSWIKTMKDKIGDMQNRYRVGWQMRLDRWIIVGEDQYLLYDGPPLENCRPLAHFKSTYNLDDFFGIGLIEPVEDLIISMILNFNHRMDYLAGTLHPPTYVPDQLLEEIGDKTMFQPMPYQVIPYDHRKYQQIGTQVFHDRFSDISQQAFIEEDKMRMYLQEVSGQTDLARGMQPSRVGDIGATGVMGLISQGSARTMMRAINCEQTGIADCLYLTLKFGDKYVQESDWVRRKNSGGFPWKKIQKDVITDEYDITIEGSRSFNQNEEVFRNMLAIAPLVLQHPAIRNQVQAMQDLMEKARWPNPENKTSGGEIQSQPAGLPGPAPQAGGVPNVQNNMQAMAGVGTPEAAQVAAGYPLA